MAEETEDRSGEEARTVVVVGPDGRPIGTMSTGAPAEGADEEAADGELADDDAAAAVNTGSMKTARASAVRSWFVP